MVGGMHGRGTCMAGGVHGGGGVHGRGHVWQGVCMAGGMSDRGCAWQGAYMARGGGMHGGGMHGRGGMHAIYTLQDMVGQCTHPTGMHSYW